MRSTNSARWSKVRGCRNWTKPERRWLRTSPSPTNSASNAIPSMLRDRGISGSPDQGGDVGAAMETQCPARPQSGGGWPALWWQKDAAHVRAELGRRPVGRYAGHAALAGRCRFDRVGCNGAQRHAASGGNESGDEEVVDVVNDSQATVGCDRHTEPVRGNPSWTTIHGSGPQPPTGSQDPNGMASSTATCDSHSRFVTGCLPGPQRLLFAASVVVPLGYGDLGLEVRRPPSELWSEGPHLSSEVFGSD